MPWRVTICHQNGEELPSLSSIENKIMEQVKQGFPPPLRYKVAVPSRKRSPLDMANDKVQTAEFVLMATGPQELIYALVDSPPPGWSWHIHNGRIWRVKKR